MFEVFSNSRLFLPVPLWSRRCLKLQLLFCTFVRGNCTLCGNLLWKITINCTDLSSITSYLPNREKKCQIISTKPRCHTSSPPRWMAGQFGVRSTKSSMSDATSWNDGSVSPSDGSIAVKQFGKSSTSRKHRRDSDLSTNSMWPKVWTRGITLVVSRDIFFEVRVTNICQLHT